MSDTLPDVEGALRTWLRTRTALTALVGQRVFFGVPKAAREDTFPLVTVQLVGTRPETSEAPIVHHLIQFDVWGSIDDSGNGRKAEALTVVNTLWAQLRDINAETALTASVVAYGLNVESLVWNPDPDNDRPRYTLTAEISARS